MNLNTFNNLLKDDCHIDFDGFYCHQAQSCFDQSSGCGFFSCYDIVFKHSNGYIYFSILLFLYILLISYSLYHFGVYITYLRNSDNRHLQLAEKFIYYIFLIICPFLRILYCYFNLTCLDNFRFVSILSDLPLLFFIFSFILVAIIYLRILNDYQDIEERKFFKTLTLIIYVASIFLFFVYLLLEIFLEYGETLTFDSQKFSQNIVIIIQSIIELLSCLIFIATMILLIGKAKDIPHFPKSNYRKIISCTIFASLALILRVIFRIFFSKILLLKYNEIQNRDVRYAYYELFLLGYYILVDIVPIVLSLLISSVETIEMEETSSMIGKLNLSTSPLLIANKQK